MNKNYVTLIAALVLGGCSLTGKNKLSDSQTTLSGDPSSTALAFQADRKFGSGLTSKERDSLSAAEKKALEYGAAGQEIGWKGETPKVSGTIVAYQPFRVGQSSCRRFEHRIVQRNKGENATGTACRRAGGDWRLIE